MPCRPYKFHLPQTPAAAYSIPASQNLFPHPVRSNPFDDHSVKKRKNSIDFAMELL
jgi:hypothetical protein